MKKVTINDKDYQIKEIGFEDMIYLEDMGVNIMGNDMGLRDIVTILAHTLGLDTIECAKELTKHVKKGGKLEDVMGVINEAMEDSGFMEG